MPKWIHDRAEHIESKNKSMPESEAWAIATQQSHATGHTPKGYGTSKGKEKAQEKYDTPEDDKDTANPKTAMINSMAEELYKLAGIGAEAPPNGNPIKNMGYKAGNYMKDVGKRTWKGQGLSGVAINAAIPLALGGTQELTEKEDPAGLGRTRPERISGFAGNIAGGMVGGTMGTDLGQGLVKAIDPRDKYMTQALGKAQSAAAASTKGIFGKPTAAAAANLKGVKAGIKGLGWKGRIASLGLRAIPMVASMKGMDIGGHIGNNIASAPFKPFRKKPQPMIAPQEQQIPVESSQYSQ